MSIALDFAKTVVKFQSTAKYKIIFKTDSLFMSSTKKGSQGELSHKIEKLTLMRAAAALKLM